MGIELDLNKELCSISTTLSELYSITKVVNAEIGSGEFLEAFNKIINRIALGYDIVTETLLPLCKLETEKEFIENFDKLNDDYANCYLQQLSKPRNLGEQAYEDFLLINNSREYKTSYPILKRTFHRFDTFIGKWIDNDAWLAMCIDNLFKRLKVLLNEIAVLKDKDSGDAFTIYHTAFTEFKSYLQLIENKRDLMLNESYTPAIAVNS